MNDDYTFDADLAIADTEIDKLRSENKSLKEDVALHQTTIKGFEAALELANEKYAECDRATSNLKLELEQCKAQSSINDELRSESRATLESYQNVLDTLRSLFNLPLKENYLDLADHVQQLQYELKAFLHNENTYTNSMPDFLREIALLKQAIADRDSELVDFNIALECVKRNNLSRKTQLEECDRQIQELQASLRNHHEQFDDLKSNTEVAYKAIAMMLESLKGDRKPDEVKEVDSVMTTFRNYDDNLTHHQKNIIIGNIQRAIANESRKLKDCKLTDFCYDDQPF